MHSSFHACFLLKFYTCRNSHHMLENLCKLEGKKYILYISYKKYFKNMFADGLTVCILQIYLSYKFKQMLVCVWNLNF